MLSWSSELDARHRVGDLARHELEAALRALVVEEDPAARVDAVGLAVVHRRVVAEHLGDAVRRTRVERRALGLRRLVHLAEHLRRRRLVEADRVVVGAADDAHRFEHAQHAEAGDLRGELGLLERELHEADRAEVVDLVGLHLLDDRDQRREVAQVALDQLERGVLALHHLDLGVGLAVHEPEDLVALEGEELGEMAAVLTGDSGDQCAFHGFDATRTGGPNRGPAGTGTRRTARASSASPIASAAERRPSSARRNPRFVS